MSVNRSNIILFAGSANPELAAAIAQKLGITLGACEIQRFPDGEVAVSLLDSVRQKVVFVVQPTSPPVNDRLIELVAFADACRRAAADQIVAVIPYFGYARADRRHDRHESIMASAVARMLQAVGIARVLTLDLHAPQIEGFFHIPVHSLSAVATICQALREKLSPETVVVSPDAGRIQMATQYAQHLHMPVIVMHKHRESGVETEVTRVIGEVGDRPCLIIDDMISTGGTITKSIEALLAAGARPEITIAATHGILLAGTEAKLSHESIRAVFVTDTVLVNNSWAKLHIVSIAPLIAAAIHQFSQRLSQ